MEAWSIFGGCEIGGALGENHVRVTWLSWWKLSKGREWGFLKEFPTEQWHEKRLTWGRYDWKQNWRRERLDTGRASGKRAGRTAALEGWEKLSEGWTRGGTREVLKEPVLAAENRAVQLNPGGTKPKQRDTLNQNSQGGAGVELLGRCR